MNMAPHDSSRTQLALTAIVLASLVIGCLAAFCHPADGQLGNRAITVGGTSVIITAPTETDVSVKPDDTVELMWLIYNDEPAGVDPYYVQISYPANTSEWKVEKTGGETGFVLAPGEYKTFEVQIEPKTDENGASMVFSASFQVRSLNVPYNLTDSITITVDNPKPAVSGYDLWGRHFDLPSAIDNNVGRFFIELGLWMLVGLMIIFILDPTIKKLTAKTETKVDDLIVSIIRKPIFTLVSLYGLVQSLDRLQPGDAILTWSARIYEIGFILIMAYLGYQFYKVFTVYLGEQYTKKKQERVEKILLPALNKIVSVIVVVVVLIVMLNSFGVDVSGLAMGMGFFSLVIGLAAQDTMSNFFAGFALILEPNFKEGDEVLYEGDIYKVKKIGMRTTIFYDITKHCMVVIPNNKLANEKLVTLSKPDTRLKDSTSVGVGYGSDVEKVERILLGIAKKSKYIITNEKDTAPFVRFKEFGDSSLNFSLNYWVRNMDDRFVAKHEINKEIFRVFNRQGIDIPFPQTVVHFARDAQPPKQADAPDGPARKVPRPKGADKA